MAAVAVETRRRGGSARLGEGGEVRRGSEGDGVHGDEDKRCRRVPHLLACLRASSLMTRRRRRRETESGGGNLGLEFRWRLCTGQGGSSSGGGG
jgi:hypothetical protein